MRATTPSRLVLALLAAVALLGGACSDDDEPAVDDSPAPSTSTTAVSSGPTAGLLEKLPADIARAKVLKVGSDVAYAPVEFFKEGTQLVQGIDPDVCAAIVAEFDENFKCEFQNSPFDGLIPALNAKRFDVIMSALSDTEERQKTIDFVDYFNAGTSILVREGNPEGIESLDDLCGKTIGLQKGTTQEELATTQAKKCETDGKGKLTVLTFEKDTDALLQLKNGRTVADMNDFPVAAYNAKTSGGGKDFEVVGEQIDAGPYGIGIRKSDTQLRDALQAALKAAIARGSYDRALQAWNAKGGALTTAAVNGG
ncbi:MAG TPA: ABC transporter substrate-binding protein [Acidimicrobiales bacterium]|nr:ABC transporter substrate-binding protein [Acidimicrobiales bacterium]